MGAEYLHMSQECPNLAFEFLKEHCTDVYDEKDLKTIKFDNAIFSLSDNHQKIIEDFWKKMISVYEDYGTLTSEEETLIIESEDRSTLPCLGATLLSKFQEQFNENNLSENDQMILNGMFHTFLRIVADSEGDDTFKISTKLLALPSIESIKDNYIFPKRGFQQLIHYLAGKINNNWIKLNDPVATINYQDILTTSNGLIEVSTESGKIYKADHVLVTLPLGVLKHKYTSLFQPRLPYRKQRAIEFMNPGTYMKVFFRFHPNDDFDTSIQRDFDYFPVWLDGKGYLDNGSCVNYDGDSLDIESCWNKFIVQIRRNSDGVWTASLFGEGAIFAERLANEDLEEGISVCLKATLRTINIPRKPTVIHKTSWISDKYSRGTYSSISPSCDEECIWTDDLARPIFDGEKVLVFFFNYNYG